MSQAGWPEPQQWQVVLCKFPMQESPTQPGSKARPALVVGIDHRVGLGYYVQVVYGTSQKLMPIKLGEVVFDLSKDAIACEMAGLQVSTKFRLERHIELPYQPAFFECAHHKMNPVIGVFTSTMQRRTLTALADLRKR